ncbi:MAG TPA: hypothetical protein VM695_15725 [Phycisphaerae bacterium]|nr:hypothetical protein [Phycisphaerae bacterium]
MDEPNVNPRVLYCVLNLAATAGRLPHQELARCDGGILLAMDDAPALQLLAQAPSVELLYYCVDDYRRAMRKLSDQEIEDAVRKRRKLFSGDPLAHGFNRLYELERVVLTWAAGATSTARGGKAKTLGLRVEANLSAMRAFSTDERYKDADFPSVLIALLEAESALLAELDGEAAPFALDGERALRRDFAKPVMSYLASQGRKEYADGLPFAEGSRAVLVRPADAAFLKYLSASGTQFVRWQDAVVTGWPVRKLPGLAAQGKTVTRLYASTGAFLDDAASLTEAQLRRELAARAEADKAFRAADLAGYVNGHRLELALLRRTATEKARKAAPDLAARLAGQAPQEADVLMAALRCHPSWAPADEGEPGKPLARLARAERRVVDEAEFLSRLAQTLQRAELSERFQSFRARKEQDLKATPLRP